MADAADLESAPKEVRAVPAAVVGHHPLERHRVLLKPFQDRWTGEITKIRLEGRKP